MIAFPLGFYEMALRILLAAFLGGMIGLERQYLRRAAGLRTYMMVAIGSALFTLVSSYGFASFGQFAAFNPAQVAAEVVVGIGFIGGGLIFISGNHVQGLTTAAGIWVVAAIGMAAALGFYRLAVFTTFLVLAVLILLRLWERFIPRGDNNFYEGEREDN